MKTIALVAALVFSLAFAGGQDDSNPLITRASFSVANNVTKFVVEFENISKFPVESMKIGKVGFAIHSKDFRPQFVVPTIPAGKKYTLTVNIKGAIFGADAEEPIRVEGSFRHGRRKHFLVFSRPADCWPKVGGS